MKTFHAARAVPDGLGGDWPLAAITGFHRSLSLGSQAISRLALRGSARIVQPMPMVALQAHYDGEHIALDEPYDLPANASLMVTLLPSAAGVDSEEAWLRAAASSEAFAFLADPAEDIYTAADGEPERKR